MGGHKLVGQKHEVMINDDTAANLELGHLLHIMGRFEIHGHETLWHRLYGLGLGDSSAMQLKIELKNKE